MISPISNLSFQAYPNKFPDKVKIQKYNQQLANGKTTELFAKNEVVEKSIPKKKKSTSTKINKNKVLYRICTCRSELNIVK